MHGAGTVLDPTNTNFNDYFTGVLKIDETMSYTFDSIGITFAYIRESSAAIVDTLVFEVFTNNNATNLGLLSLNVGSTIPYGVNPIITPYIKFDTLTGHVNATDVQIKVPLTESDTIGTGLGMVVYKSVAIPSPFSVNAGKVVGAVAYFIPGYTWVDSDTINSASSTKNQFYFWSYEEHGQGTYPSYDEDDYNGSHYVTTGTAFNPSDQLYGKLYPAYIYSNAYLEHHMIDFCLTADYSMTNVDELNSINGITLSQNYPNPFSNTAIINYELQNNTSVVFDIYNITGEKIMTIEEGEKTAGKHNVTLNAENLAAGAYYFTLTTNNIKLTKKMLIIK